MYTINTQRGSASVEWFVSDVRKLINDRNIKFKRPLTDDECLEILKLAVSRHEHSEGVNYDVIEYWMFNLYRDRIINARCRHGWYR